MLILIRLSGILYGFNLWGKYVYFTIGDELELGEWCVSVEISGVERCNVR